MRPAPAKWAKSRQVIYTTIYNMSKWIHESQPQNKWYIIIQSYRQYEGKYQIPYTHRCNCGIQESHQNQLMAQRFSCANNSLCKRDRTCVCVFIIRAMQQDVTIDKNLNTWSLSQNQNDDESGISSLNLW